MTIPSAFSSAKTGLRVMAGSLALAAFLGAAGSAMAGSARHHGQVAREDFSALATPGPAASASWTGTWRYRMFRNGGCDKSYPMHEGYSCGSATGGPVGGMGS